MRKHNTKSSLILHRTFHVLQKLKTNAFKSSYSKQRAWSHLKGCRGKEAQNQMLMSQTRLELRRKWHWSLSRTCNKTAAKRFVCPIKKKVVMLSRKVWMQTTQQTTNTSLSLLFFKQTWQVKCSLGLRGEQKKKIWLLQTPCSAQFICLALDF